MRLMFIGVAGSKRCRERPVEVATQRPCGPNFATGDGRSAGPGRAEGAARVRR